MLKSLKTQIMILVVHGFRQILLLKAGVRIKCMKLQHPVGKKCYHLKAVVGDILKMYTTNYFLRAGCGLGQTAVVFHARKHTLMSVKEKALGLGGQIVKLDTHKKQLKRLRLF